MIEDEGKIRLGKLGDKSDTGIVQHIRFNAVHYIDFKDNFTQLRLKNLD